jgi:carbon storage regulator CsrA
MVKAISPENGDVRMLVLSRKSYESVVIGGAPSLHPPLKVTVLGIQGGRVKLGFEADSSIAVQRAEVWERIRAGELPDGRSENFNEFTVR